MLRVARHHAAPRLEAHAVALAGELRPERGLRSPRRTARSKEGSGAGICGEERRTRCGCRRTCTGSPANEQSQARGAPAITEHCRLTIFDWRFVVDWRLSISDWDRQSPINIQESTTNQPSTIVKSSIHTRAVFSAASTLSLRNGTRRRRTPAASKIALAIAASVGLQTVSPAP